MNWRAVGFSSARGLRTPRRHANFAQLLSDPPELFPAAEEVHALLPRLMVDRTLESPQPQLPLAGEPFHRWIFPDGTPWTTFYRKQSGILLRFPDLADFCVSADGRSVVCIPVPGVSSATVEHLFLNQVLPLALGRLGRLVFHASAVELADGAIAFLAAAGRGKSTLCAAFAVNGQRFLTDDGLILESDQNGFGGRFHVIPSHPSIRLWRDSQEQLIAADARQIIPVEYSSKARFLAGNTLNYCSDPRRLLAAYFLGDGSAGEISLKRLTEAEALIEWAKNSFLLDVEDKAMMGAHFDRIVALANQVPCYQLDYRRHYEDLPELLNKLMGHVAKLGSTQ